MFPELDEGFAVLFVILSLSAGCMEESMDILHAISLLQPLPWDSRNVLEEQKLWMDGTKEWRGNAA